MIKLLGNGIVFTNQVLSCLRVTRCDYRNLGEGGAPCAFPSLPSHHHAGFRRIDLGLFYSSMAETLVGYIVFRLIHDGHLSENLSRRLEALGR
jgi:hypothetical protein